MENQTVFAKPINVNKVKSQGMREKIKATGSDCQQLAETLKLDNLHSLTLTCLIKPWKKGGVAISGEITAVIEETCVVTLESFKTEITEPIERYFERATNDQSAAPVLELDDIDDVPDVIENTHIDIGAIAIETLALLLSPHPRKPGVVFDDHLEFDPDSEEEKAGKNPFDVLKQLKKH